MSRLSYFFARIQTVLAAALLACSLSTGLCATQSLPDASLLRYETLPNSAAQANAEQLLYIEHRAATESHRTRIVTFALVLMFLFGAFCALWAQNTSRSAILWFFIGFALNLGAVLLILWLNPRKRKKRVRRYRAIMDFWTLAER